MSRFSRRITFCPCLAQHFLPTPQTPCPPREKGGAQKSTAQSVVSAIWTIYEKLRNKEVVAVTFAPKSGSRIRNSRKLDCEALKNRSHSRARAPEARGANLAQRFLAEKLRNDSCQPLQDRFCERLNGRDALQEKGIRSPCSSIIFVKNI